MKTYELTYIVTPTASQEDVESIQKEVESLIQVAEGVIIKSDRVGAKTLSYPIKNNISGYFAIITFQVIENKLKEIKAKLEHENKVLRHIVVIKRPEKEMKARSMRRYALRPEAKRSVFARNLEDKKTDKVEVKEEEINKKLDEILSE